MPRKKVPMVSKPYYPQKRRTKMDKKNLELLDLSKIQTIREFAMYILGIADQNLWSDGYVLDCIIDACHQILGDKE